jgi:hypothetical protein
MRFPGKRRDRGDTANEQRPSQVVCPVCGLRNDVMSRFCRNCGLPLGAPRDPVRGTISRRADLPSDHGAGIAAIVGLLAAVVVLAGAGWLILRSNSASDDGVAAAPTATPVVTLAPGSTARPQATGGILPSRAPAGSLEPGALPTRRPLSSAEPAATEPPVEESPAPEASGSPAPLVADTDFTCEQADFDDPTKGKWRITQALWGARDKWDELTLVLRREQGKGDTNISVESMTAREAAQITGLDEALSSRVILITFDGDVRINDPIVALLSSLRQLSYLNVESTSEATYAIVGVNRDTCYRMVAPAWKNGKATAVGDTMKLLLDVRYR